MRRFANVVLATILAIACAVLVLKGSVLVLQSGSWSQTGILSNPRVGASAAVLPGGRILVTGGDSGSGPTASADSFNTDGTISAAPPMMNARSKHVSVALQDGRVLVAGGLTTGGVVATSTAEIFDPVANSWTSVALGMTEARSGATAAVLPDGRVLVAGGQNGTAISSTLEIFDPVANAFSAAGMMSSPRSQHAMAVLQDGRVLIVGGNNGTAPVASTSIFDPVAGTVTAGPALNIARYGHSATTLLNGVVVVIGGNNGNANAAQMDVTPAELFDPAAGTFSTLATNLTTPREGHLAFLLPNNNNVLIVGGTSAGTTIGSAELFSQWQGTFAATGMMTTARSSATGSANQVTAPTSVMQRNGVLMVAGGTDASGNALNSTEAYGFPTVQTDQSDYPPGATVTITGSGWQPGEAVTLQLVESPFFDTHGPFTVAADANGKISDSSFVTDQHDVGIMFALTAIGGTSGFRAQTTFADSFSVACTPNPDTIESNTTCTATETGNSESGSTITFSVSAGGTGTFTPAAGTCTIVGNGASCSVTYKPTSAPTGSQTITGTSSKNSGATGSTTLTVSRLTPTVQIISESPVSSVTGQPVTVNFSVTGVTGQPNPTGNVTVTITNSSATCTGTLTAGNPSTGSCSLTPTTAGSENLTSTYNSDGVYNTATATAPYTVNKDGTTTTITGNVPSSVAVGQAVSVTFTVAANSPGSGTATGNVTVSDGTGDSCTGTVLTGSCSLTPTSTGTKTLTAVYAGDANFLTSTSAGVSETVTTRATTTTVSLNPASVVVGQASTITVTVTDGGTGTQSNPAGTIALSSPDANDTFTTCTPAISGLNAATCTATVTPKDTGTSPRNITATYTPNDNVHATSNGSASLTVAGRTTTTGVSLNPTSVSAGQASTITVTVTDTSSSGTKTNPAGTIAFTSTDTKDNLVFGTCTLAPSGGTAATCTATVTPGFDISGSENITATYTPNDNVHATSNGSSPLTVTGRTTSTSVTVNPASVVVGQASTITVTVTDTGTGTQSNPAGTIALSSPDANDTFTTCTLAISGANAATCTATVTAKDTGTSPRNITGAYNPNDNVHATSNGAASLTITPRMTSTSITLNPTSVLVGQASTITVTVTDTSSTGTPSNPGGTIAFSSPDTNDTFTTCTLANSGANAATCAATVTPKDTGTSPRSITATYTPADNVHSTSNSAASLTVSTRTTSTSVALNPSSVGVGQASTITVTVTDTSSTGTQSNPGGTITFSSPDTNDTFTTCTLATSGGNAATCTATVTPHDLGTSGRSITATYTPTDSVHSGSNGSASLTVTQPDLIATKTDSVGGSTTVGNSWTWNITVKNVGTGSANFTANNQVILTDNLPSANITYANVIPGNFVSVTNSGQIGCSISGTTLTCVQSGNGQFVSIAAGGSFTVQITATPSAAGTFANPASGGICEVDPNNNVGESNLANNFCSDTVTVSAANTSTTITSTSATNGFVGQPVTVNFKVANTSGTGVAPTGTVSVSDGVGDICSGTLTTGAAGVSTGSCSLTPTTTGTKTLVASFPASSNFNASSSTGTSYTVTARTTSTAVTLTPSSVTTGGSSIVSVTVTDTAGAATSTPGGTVSFTSSDTGANGDTFNPTSCTLTNGSCSVTVTTHEIGTGSHAITATYASNDNVHAGSSGNATLTITGTPPTINSVASTTFTAGVPGSFTVTTTGTPTPSLSESGTLPGTVTFTDNHNGTATLAGTAATAGSFGITITAQNGVGSNATQAFTLVVTAGSITHLVLTPATASITAGASQPYTAQGVDGFGNPAGDVTSSTTFTIAPDGGCTGASCSASVADFNGSSHTVTGTYTPNGATGSASLTVTAGTLTQLQLLVPGETSAPGTSAGKTGTPNIEYVNGPFNVTVNAVDQFFNVVTTVTDAVHITSNDANAILPANAPLANGIGTFSVTLETVSYNPNITTLTASDATNNSITSDTSPALEVIVAYTAAINPNMAGTGDASTYTLTVSNAPAPNTNSLASVKVAVPAADQGTITNVSVTATQSGGPTVNWSYDATLIPGTLRFFENTANDAVTPGGTITITFTATTSAPVSGTVVSEVWTTTAFSDAASQNSLPLAGPEPTVKIGQAPAITSASTATFTFGTAGTFTVASTGFPVPTLSESGALPSGVRFTDNGDGSATLAGTPGAAGTFPITITAHNGFGPDATQPFTLTVNQATQAITITLNAPATAVYNTSFVVSATGGGSGNPITFAPVANSVCSVGTVTNSSGTFSTTVTMTSGTGTCQLNLNQAGNTNYLAAPQVQTAVTTAQKANQTITVTIPAPTTAFFASQFTVAATASSGNAVTFSSAGVCTNTGATFTMISGTGICTVNFDQAGDANFNAAPEVQEFVTAERVPQTINFGALSDQTFGDPSFTVNAIATSGLPVVFSSLTTNVCTTSGTYGSTVTIIAAGTCTIKADQPGDVNYLPALSVTQSFTVNKAATATTVSSSNLSAAVVGEPVTFTVSVTDASNGSTGTPTGTVTISDGTSAIGLITLSSGGGTFTTALLSSTGSPHSINAHYNGNPNFQPSDATALSQTINTRGTSTTLAFNPAQGTFETPDTITVTVAEAASLPGPSGTPGSFIASGNLGASRKGATATQLLSGLILVTGGQDGSGSTLGSAELYNPATGTSVPSGGTLGTPRYGAAAALLADGRVLIAGGTGASGTLPGAEIYNPATDTFTPTGSLATARTGAAATLLSAGTVIVIGGSADGTTALGTVESFDPTANSGAGAFSTPNSGTGLNAARFGHVAALLASGKILVAGGNGGLGALNSAELYDPTANTSSALTATLSVTREFAGAALMPNGYVLVAGGDSDGSTPLGSADLYDPQAQKFYASNAVLGTARTQFHTVQLNNGQVLAGGGAGPTPPSTNAALASVEAYTPAFTPQGVVALSSTGTGDSFTGTCQLQPAMSATNPAQSACTETIDPGAAGSDSVTSSYSADAVHSSSTSGAISFTVNPATTSTTVSSSSNPSIYGQSVTFTAVVSNTSAGSTGVPTGAVSFTIDGGASTAGTPSACPSGSPTYSLCATYSTASLAVSGSPHSVIASYANTDGNFTGSDNSKSPLMQTVNPAPTSTTVTSSANPSIFGQSVTFTATVTNTAGAGIGAATPTGSVQFYVDGTAFGSAVTVSGSGATAVGTSGATATLTVNGSPHSVTAKYTNADGNFSGSNGALTPGQTVTAAPTTTTVVSNPNPSIYGQSVTFTAFVTNTAAVSQAVPTGSVSFTIDGGSAIAGTIGTCPTAIPANSLCATYSTSALVVNGSAHSVSATYTNSDGNFQSGAGSLNGGQTVQPATLTIIANPQAKIYAQLDPPLTFTPTGFKLSDTVGTVLTGFLTRTAGENVSTYAITQGTLAANSNYVIQFTGNIFTITQATTSTMVSSSLNPSNWGNVVTLTATVSDSSTNSTGAPTGTVSFYNVPTGTTCSSLGTIVALDTEPLSLTSPYTASTSTPNLPVGNDTILACYNGDPNFFATTTGNGTSTTLAQTVIPAPIVTLAPSGLSFGGQQGGTVSGAQTVYVCNGPSIPNCASAPISTAALVITGIGFTNPNTNTVYFTQTSTCPIGGTGLAVGGSCAINVKFAPPLSAQGIATALLTVTDNNENLPGSMQSTTLVGAGTSSISSVGSLSTYAIFATANGCSSVNVSGNGTVDSFGGASNSGNVGTNGNVTLSGNPVISGAVYSPIAGTGNCSAKTMTGLSTSGKAQATGGLKTLSAPVSYPLPPAPNPAPPTTNQSISGSCGSISGCTPGGSKSVNLAPGQYGNLNVSGNTTVHVKAGTYNVNSLTLSGNSILYVDSGPVIINLAGTSMNSSSPAMDLSGGSIVNPSGITSNLQFYYAGSSSIKLSGGTGSYALVYAPNAAINVSGGSHFYGSMIGSTINSSGNTAIHYDAALPSINGGNYIWFSSTGLNVKGLPSTGSVKLYVTNASISFTANGTNYNLPVPNAVVTFSSTATSQSTTWDATNNRWSTLIPTSSVNGNATIHNFFDGVAFLVPSGGFPNGIQNVTWQAAYSTSTTGLSFNWQWGAAVYNAFSAAGATGNYTGLNVNPLDSSVPAGTPQAYEPNLVFGDTGAGYTGLYVGTAGVVPTIAPLSVAPSSYDFGTVNHGTPATAAIPFVLTNNDTVSYTISSIQMTGTNPGDFLQTNNCPTSPNALAAGASCTFTVTFTPSTSGGTKETAKIVVNDNANNSPQTVFLKGLGE